MGIETQSQVPGVTGPVPVTTPTFSGAPVPGIGGGAQTTQDPNQKAKQILATLLQAANRKQMANTAVPSPIPSLTDPNDARSIGMNTAWPHAWGTQRFLAGLAGNIKNAVAKQKQNQLVKAEGDWTYLQSAMNELFAAQQSGDQQATQAAQLKVDAVLGDPKKLKNMAKALNQDWLNPEKTTVYGEALKKVAAQSKQKDQTQAQDAQQKQQAATGLKGLFQKLIRERPQPELSDEQRQSMAREIQAKAPTTTAAIDPKLAIEATKAEAELIKALKTSPEKYDIKQITDPDDPSGKRQILVATDKTDPTKPYVEIKSSGGQKAEAGKKQVANEGKLEIVGGIPTGRVMHDGRYVAPGQSGYTKEDKDAVDAGLTVQGLSEKQKEKLASIRGSSYAVARAANTPIAVTDNETGESRYATMLDVARNPGKYVQPGESEKIAARDSVHRSLKVNFEALGKDLDKLPNGLDTETQATVALALKNDNPGVLETLMINKVKQGAPDEVLKYITDIKVMQEDILVLRNVGGLGQGSDMMRAAMVRTIPGAGSSSVKEAKMQMEGAQRTSESLFKGRPEAKFTGAGGDEGAMETRTYNGAVYQRKKGSTDAWTLVPKPKQ